jgi:hypothetical protein
MYSTIFKNTLDGTRWCFKSLYYHAEPNVSYGRYCSQEEGTWSLFARVVLSYLNFQTILNNLTCVNTLTIIYVFLCSRITTLSFNIRDWNLTFEIQESFWDECDQTYNYRTAKLITCTVLILWWYKSVCCRGRTAWATTTKKKKKTLNIKTNYEI